MGWATFWANFQQLIWSPCMDKICEGKVLSIQKYDMNYRKCENAKK
jgi:DNA-directed RNA polymerase subunit E'/Rpb7